MNNDANIIHYNKLSVVIFRQIKARHWIWTDTWALSKGREKKRNEKKCNRKMKAQLDPYASQNCMIWNQSKIERRNTKIESNTEQNGNRFRTMPLYTHRIRFFFCSLPLSVFFFILFMTFDMNNLINYRTNCPEFSFKRFYCLNCNKVLMCTHIKREKNKKTHTVVEWLCTACVQTAHRRSHTYTHA